MSLGRAGLAINVLAVAWLAFETVNIAWPRASLAPPGAPAYQVWAAPIVLTVIAVAGLAYLVVAKPYRKLAARCDLRTRLRFRCGIRVAPDVDAAAPRQARRTQSTGNSRAERSGSMSPLKCKAITFENERKRRGAVLRVMCLSLMMVVASVASLNVGLPDLARDTGATQTQLQWIVDAYALAFAALLLPAGAIGDRFGRKQILAVGLALFGLASLAAMFVSTPEALIGLRVAMGIGAAFVMPVTLSVITTIFPPEERGKAVGTWVGVAAGGAVIGLLVSGVLLAWLSWPAIFGLNVVLAAIALAGTIAIVPKTASRGRRASTRRNDALGHRARGARLRDHRRRRARLE